MIKVEEGEVQIVGQGANILSEFTVLANVFIDKVLNQFGKEKAVEVLKDAIDLAATDDDVIDAFIAEEIGEDERSEYVRKIIEQALKGKK